jgi:penicillin-binding protein 1A
MLEIEGRVVRLFGVEGTRGRARRDYRCRVDDQDLSRVVLFNGGGRAAANATPELRALEQQARSTRVGIWSRRNNDED